MNDELQREAIALVKKYGWALPKGVKDFMRRLADHLNWDQLKGVL